MAQPRVSQADDEVIGSKGIVKKSELIRIMVQTLYSLGYKNLAARLEEESGISLHSHSISLLMEQITGGKWHESIATLPNIGLADSDKIKLMSILILEQRFFELLDDNKLMEALMTVRTDIAPLCNESGRLNTLCSFIVLPSKYQQFRGDVQEPVLESRKRLQKELKSLLPPEVMIPENRLVKLLEQSFDSQRNACRFHNSRMDDVSLLTDHQCGREVIPSETLQILKEHSDEVWFLKFSHNGKYLVSSSRDRWVIIWEVRATGELSVRHSLSGFHSPVADILWRDDDLQILTYEVDGIIRRWDILSGKCLVFHNGAPMQPIVTKENHVASLKWSGDIVEGITAALYQPIVSFSFTKGDEFFLANMLNQELHLWSRTTDIKLIAKFKGPKYSRFFVGSCFGGLDEGFIASGSEDSQVYIWHRDTGKLVTILPGHSAVVNSVSWNPSNPHMLASASDDHTIRIWGCKLAE